MVDFLDRNNNAPEPKSPIPNNIPKLDWARAVDGRRCLRIYRQLPTSSCAQKTSFEVRSRIVGIYDKGPGKGTVMEREHNVVDSVTGLVYTRSWETAFFLKTGGWGGERGEYHHRGSSYLLLYLCSWVGRTGPPILSVPPPTSRQDISESFQTTEQTAYIYRYVSYHLVVTCILIETDELV